MKMDKQKMPVIEDFAIVKPISRGAFGKVFLGYKKSCPSEMLAIKVVKKANIVNKNMVEQIITERDALARTKSPFCVQLFYSLQTHHNVYLIMEYLIGGDLKSLVSLYGYFDESMAVFYAAELVLALEYLHGRGIIHRDVKPDNLLLDNRGHLKLTDFGLSEITLHRDLKAADLAAITPMASSGFSYVRTPGQLLSLTCQLSFTSEDGNQTKCASSSGASSSVLDQTPVRPPPSISSRTRIRSRLSAVSDLVRTPPPFGDPQCALSFSDTNSVCIEEGSVNTDDADRQLNVCDLSPDRVAQFSPENDMVTSPVSGVHPLHTPGPSADTSLEEPPDTHFDYKNNSSKFMDVDSSEVASRFETNSVAAAENPSGADIDDGFADTNHIKIRSNEHFYPSLDDTVKESIPSDCECRSDFCDDKALLHPRLRALSDLADHMSPVAPNPDESVCLSIKRKPSDIATSSPIPTNDQENASSQDISGKRNAETLMDKFNKEDLSLFFYKKDPILSSGKARLPLIEDVRIPEVNRKRSLYTSPVVVSEQKEIRPSSSPGLEPNNKKSRSTSSPETEFKETDLFSSPEFGPASNGNYSSSHHLQPTINKPNAASSPMIDLNKKTTSISPPAFKAAEKNTMSPSSPVSEVNNKRSLSCCSPDLQPTSKRARPESMREFKIPSKLLFPKLARKSSVVDDPTLAKKQRSGLTQDIDKLSLGGKTPKNVFNVLRIPLQNIQNVKALPSGGIPNKGPNRDSSVSSDKSRLGGDSRSILRDESMDTDVFSPVATQLDSFVDAAKSTTKYVRWFSESDVAGQSKNESHALHCSSVASQEPPTNHAFSSFHTPVRLLSVPSTPLTAPRPSDQTPLRQPKSVRRGRPPANKDTRILGTPDYLAPELLLKLGHGPAVDVWAVGVCLYEFATGCPPFCDESPEAVFRNILQRDLSWPEGEESLSKQMEDCINKLLSSDPQDRPDWSLLKKFPLFHHVDWENLRHAPAPFEPQPDDATDTFYFTARNNMQNLAVSDFDL